VPAAIGLAPAGAAIPTVFFFSEYVEGSGFNKAVEIFNGTGASIDLGALGYTLELYSNGAAIPSQTVARSGTVADGDVFVVSRADAVFTVAFRWWHSRPAGSVTTLWPPRPSSTTTNGSSSAARDGPRYRPTACRRRRRVPISAAASDPTKSTISRTSSRPLSISHTKCGLVIA
jgi:hypothetical protein